MPALFHQDRRAAECSENVRSRANTADDGRADENSLRHLAVQFQQNNAAIHLSPIPVSLNREIHQTEGRLIGVGDGRSQKNGTGAGPENGFTVSKGSNRSEQIFRFQESEHRGALASRNNQSVDPFEVGGSTDFDRVAACALDRLAMRFKVALEREHTNPDRHGMAHRNALPAARLHQFALGQLRDFETRHGFAEFLARFEQLYRIPVIGSSLNDRFGALFRV